MVTAVILLVRAVWVEIADNASLETSERQDENWAWQSARRKFTITHLPLNSNLIGLVRTRSGMPANDWAQNMWHCIFCAQSVLNGFTFMPFYTRLFLLLTATDAWGRQDKENVFFFSSCITYCHEVKYIDPSRLLSNAGNCCRSLWMYFP